MNQDFQVIQAELLFDGLRDFDGAVPYARFEIAEPPAVRSARAIGRAAMRQDNKRRVEDPAGLLATMSRCCSGNGRNGRRDQAPGLGSPFQVGSPSRVEVGSVPTVHLGLFQRGDGFVRKVLDAQGAGRQALEADIFVVVMLGDEDPGPPGCSGSLQQARAGRLGDRPPSTAWRSSALALPDLPFTPLCRKLRNIRANKRSADPARRVQPRRRGSQPAQARGSQIGRSRPRSTKEPRRRRGAPMAQAAIWSSTSRPEAGPRPV